MISDQVLGAAINVYANRHRERQTGLIDKLSSNHRYVHDSLERFIVPY